MSFPYLSAGFTVAGLLFLIAYVRAKLKAYDVKELLLKSAVSFLFIAAALANEAISGSQYGYFVIAALVCGLLGDIWLDLKYVYPADNDIYTFTGFKAFGIGHIFFIAGLLTSYADFSRPGYILIPLLLAAVAGVVTGLSGKLMKLDYGKYRSIVMVYAALLFGTAALAFSLALMNGFAVRALNLMTVGGVLFAASDLILSGTYFGEGRERPVDIIGNYITYYGAQYVIAWCILFAI